ncbi:serine--tRNA ligase [Actinophytocola algeriensis]|uniref:Serine--tRNA ligase n=1 Tax=Actinophytocola algeriensis TaxID=1768010 RepID=A0A7W7VE64_9PSEU|nr:serine--tRNA ligase [Actinophytocola algeriensis]MBB4906675.1 seryl-tRNA synthetase [Actinophytocola algeriensis]MBE1478156.1 seryl-tRNA synthetase [Actinophytocola algeriensis]
MHDPRLLLDPATDAVRKLARRGFTLDLVALEKLFSQRTTVIGQTDESRAESNRAAKEIGAAAKRGEDVTAVKENARALKARVQELEEQQRQLAAELDEVMLGIPNLPSDDLPDGNTDEDAELVSSWGEPPSFDFEPKDHVALGEQLGILDFARATKLSGPRFSVTRGAGARLERAIATFLLELHTEKHGYTEYSMPVIVNRPTMTGTGQLPKFEQDLFRTAVADRELFLIPTAEVPLTNLHAGETLPAEDLPFGYTSNTPCFRSEAGSYGKDTRGLIRLHQFQKVELVRFCTPDRADAEFDVLLSHAETCLRELGLAYRVVKLAAGDLGFSAERTYDLEVWLPGQGRYREISSVSDFGTFQARRAGIRTKAKDGTRGFANTLNGSGLPIGRTLVAILEQNQQADGSVVIPPALVPYTRFERIDPDGTVGE